VSEGDKGNGPVKCVPLGEGETLWLFGDLVTFYALGEDTGGAFTLFEESTVPETGAIPHLHYEEDQAFYILEGEYEFTCPGRTFAAEAGSFVYVPRGTVHSFMNVGKVPGRMLVLSTPAGGTEKIFFALGEPALDESSPPPDAEPPDLGELREVLRKHGSDIDTLALLQQLSAKTHSPNQDP
jgi:mannose-6-phosphate isomerase-like protein (cupin superfamily)